MSHSDPEQVELKTSVHDIESAQNKLEIGQKPEIDQADRPLSKQELEDLANTPFWQRIRWATIVFFWGVWICMLGLTIYIVVNAKADILEKERALVFDGNLGEIAGNEAVVVYNELNDETLADITENNKIVIVSEKAEFEVAKFGNQLSNKWFPRSNSATNNTYFSKIDEEILRAKLDGNAKCETVSFSGDTGFIAHDSDEASAKVMAAARFGKMFVAKNNQDLVDDQIAKFTCEEVECEDLRKGSCFDFNFSGELFKIS
jgi:hypothetical protein